MDLIRPPFSQTGRILIYVFKLSPSTFATTIEA